MIRVPARRASARIALTLAAAALQSGCEPAGGPAVASADDRRVAVSTAPERTVGMDSTRLAVAVAAAARLPRLHSLIVARHGEVVVEHRFRGPGLDAPANVKSVSKSVLSALIGIAIEEGVLDGVDQPVAPYFQRYLAHDDDPRRRRITVGDLLSMQSGLDRTSGSSYGAWVSSPNWVRYAITRPMVAEPGGQRIYSTGNSHLLSAVLTEAAGTSTWSFARDRLAGPLGITIPRWMADPQGIYFGGNEMRLSPRALLTFGELYRNHGRHDGRQVIPEEWVRASLEPRASSRWSGDGYGYGWFLTEIRGHPTFYAWGFGGQFIFVVPGLELTIVATSDPVAPRERDHTRALRRILADDIIPAAEAGSAPGSRVEG